MFRSIVITLSACLLTGLCVHHASKSGAEEKINHARDEGAQAGEAKAKKQYEEKFRAMADFCQRQV